MPEARVAPEQRDASEKPQSPASSTVAPAANSQDRGQTLDLPLKQPAEPGIAANPSPAPVVEARTERTASTLPTTPAAEPVVKKDETPDTKPVDRESDNAA
jgi:hypothetical protein